MFRGLDERGHGVLLEDCDGTYKLKRLDSMGAPDKIVLLSAQTVFDMAEFVEKREAERIMTLVDVPPEEVRIGEAVWLEFHSAYGVFRSVETEHVAAIRKDDGILRLIDRTGKVFYNSETHAGMKIGVLR